MLSLLLFTLAVSARLHSLPEDTYAFPKYRVAFLNGLPVLNETAQHWLNHGLRGGELEFLDQPWRDVPSQAPPQLKEIASTDSPAVSTPPSDLSTTNYTLQHIKMGPKDSYICLIPKPAENSPARQQEDLDTDVTPARSWSLLQPLSGTCLYQRQGWFTYSYCHNHEIRQFREAVQPQSRVPAGTYRPEEDPEQESYTLGRAPRSPEETGADLTIAEQDAQAANLELARNAGSRYLVQRWGDGTLCDKTNRPREVEVQFHCSMVMTDHILFVKEAKTCSYVLVIHTPRLCGEPGFKSRRDAGDESQIRCREVVDTKPEGQLNLPTADHPLKVPQRKTVLPTLQVPLKEKVATTGEGKTKTKEQLYNDLLKKTLRAMMDHDDDGKEKSGFSDDGEVIVEFVQDGSEVMSDSSNRVFEALRAAGYDVRAEYVSVSNKGKKNDNENEKDVDNENDKVLKPKPVRYLDDHDEL